jgi:outer membrane protein assembly factor BamB
VGLWAKTGVEKWRTDLSCTGYKFQLATPAYGEGKIFAATNDGHVYALKADVGTIVWGPVSTGDIQLNTPVKYAGGKVYVGSWTGKNIIVLMLQTVRFYGRDHPPPAVDIIGPVPV